MLTLRLHMEFTPQTCDEAAAVLRSLVGPVRSEPGCSATRLLRDTEDGRELTWVEEWRGVEDLLALWDFAWKGHIWENSDQTNRR